MVKTGADRAALDWALKRGLTCADGGDFLRIRRSVAIVNSAKFQFERDIVERFVRELGHGRYSLSDPNAGKKTDSGADVLLQLNGRRYGVQVTIYHSDEGSTSTQKGSALRRQESAYSHWPTAYAMYTKPNPWTGLAHRIQAKCSKQYSRTAFDELVLLIAASVPQMGAVVSTFLWDQTVDIAEMNAFLSPILGKGPYSSAYLYNMMGIGCRSVYEWTRESGVWRKIPRAGSV